MRGAFASPDGRWTLVSTVFVATISAAITWLTLAAEPHTGANFEPRRMQAALPYNLFAQLIGTDPSPGIVPEDARTALYRQASLVPGIVGAATRPAHRVTEHMGVRVHRGPDRRSLTVGEGDTLMGMLTEAGVPSPDAAAVITALKPVFSPRNIRPGQTFEATFLPMAAAQSQRVVRAGLVPVSTDDDEDRTSLPPVKLLSLSFSPSVVQQITVKLNDDGEYDVENFQKELQPRYAHAGATINSSLYLAAMQSGIPGTVVVQMIRMFSYDVDFQRDVRPGDKFEVFYNTYYTPEGVEAKSGDILAATMILGGRRHTLYRFEAPDGVEYFDENGRSAKNMLMKTPVDGARISSGFGMRFHPVLGYSRMHKGVDFAVPTGTPVMAAGSGVIQFAGRQNGYGNLIVVNHGNGYATAYGHLSRFGRGMRVGSRVRQGQVIAFSGMTGMATGPHLHYEIRLNKVQLNPNRVKVAQGRRLAGRELKQFVAQRDRADQLIAQLPLQHTVAQASAGLRDASDE
jgi:murein DD-endopeptidase MepM/ murein hydrolase activator NlpD